MENSKLELETEIAPERCTEECRLPCAHLYVGGLMDMIFGGQFITCTAPLNCIRFKPKSSKDEADYRVDCFVPSKLSKEEMLKRYKEIADDPLTIEHESEATRDIIRSGCWADEHYSNWRRVMEWCVLHRLEDFDTQRAAYEKEKNKLKK